jgi:hypothetical protein
VAPQSFFKTGGICRVFVNSKVPLISYSQMCQPHCQGGLGLMESQKQPLGMQFRWLNIVLRPHQYPSFLGPILLHHLCIALWTLLFSCCYGSLFDEALSHHIASLWFATFDSIRSTPARFLSPHASPFRSPPGYLTCHPASSLSPITSSCASHSPSLHTICWYIIYGI